MEIDKYGRVTLSEQEAFDALYSGKIQSLAKFFFDKDLIEKFNNSQSLNRDSFGKINLLENDLESLELFDEANQSEWFMPEEYQNFPMHQWLLDQCKSDLEKDRVDLELKLFIQHNMFDLLFYLKYLVDTMRSNNIVWGVGRGSSVASYVLYLLGIHKIDSLKYQLDIEEFLK